jgi:hypothetical protein
MADVNRIGKPRVVRARIATDCTLRGMGRKFHTCSVFQSGLNLAAFF